MLAVCHFILISVCFCFILSEAFVISQSSESFNNIAKRQETLPPAIAKMNEPVKNMVMGMANMMNNTPLGFFPQQLQRLYDGKFTDNGYQQYL